MSNILEQLEKYVDKIIFTVVGLLCLALLWFFVISNPYGAKYKGKKFSPGQFDRQVSKDVALLEDKMGRSPVISETHIAQSGAYIALLTGSMASIDKDVYIPLPSVSEDVSNDNRKYVCPEIPSLEEVSAEWYRTVAHVPTEKVDLANTYKQAPCEYGDVDIVSVQATFDMEQLASNFTNSFNPSLGGMLKKYRSSEYAKPLFAAVVLERQEFGENSWDEWKVVPRNKADAYADHLDDIPSDMSEVEIGGIELIIVNYDSPEIQNSIVQPLCYEFASDIDTWFPPALHADYIKITKLQRDKKLKDERRAERGERTTRGRDNAKDMMEMMEGGSKDPRRRGRTPVKRGPRTVKNIQSDYNKLLLKEKTQLANYRKPLVVWAHDDTIEPEKKYRYRMRIGVFNPTAGKGWFHGDDEDKAGKVVLWSDYTDATEQIEIDPMIYFFPVEVARDKQSASIQVSRFAMGNWQSHKFDVAMGELIGKPVEVKDESKTDETREMMEGYDGYGEPKEPEIVDYSTGTVLVDIVEVSDWVGASSLRGRKYSDVLYSVDGSTIERLPTKKSNWPKYLQTKFGRIRTAQEIEIKLLTKGTSAPQNRNMNDRNMRDYEMKMMELEMGRTGM